MKTSDQKITLGLTGSFGSGCSTLAEALNAHGYRRISLSAAIRTEWNQQHSEAGTTPSRKELQDLGNALRETKSTSYLAQVAATEAKASSGNIVFDGIRNLAEAQYLREAFPNFFLIAVWCPQQERWKRIQSEYNGSETDFMADDERDKDEELSFGQQVQLCVDNADIVISNESSHNSRPAAVGTLKAKIHEYLSLLDGNKLRPPTQAEAAMAAAYTYSLRSLCIKRQVGAVIADTSNLSRI